MELLHLDSLFHDAVQIKLQLLAAVGANHFALFQDRLVKVDALLAGGAGGCIAILVLIQLVQLVLVIILVLVILIVQILEQDILNILQVIADRAMSSRTSMMAASSLPSFFSTSSSMPSARPFR